MNKKSIRFYKDHEVKRNGRGSIWLHFAVRPPSQVNRRKIGLLKV